MGNPVLAVFTKRPNPPPQVGYVSKLVPAAQRRSLPPHCVVRSNAPKARFVGKVGTVRKWCGNAKPSSAGADDVA